MLRIQEDDLSGEAVRALLALHLADMQTATPREYAFALDLAGLKAADVTVWSVWDGDALVGIGALKQHDSRLGEVKSMRTDARHLRKGSATLLLLHIIAEARRRGLERLSLETGTGPEFEAAYRLYLRHGFQDGDAFADYQPSPYNRFMHLALP